MIVFTVLETAKVSGLNPEAYLYHLQSVLPERSAADPQAAVDPQGALSVVPHDRCFIMQPRPRIEFIRVDAGRYDFI